MGADQENMVILMGVDQENMVIFLGVDQETWCFYGSWSWPRNIVFFIGLQ